MSDSYTKLFSSITESTLWGEPAGTRLVWITMLAKCNRSGEVFAAVPGLARLANVTLQETEAALHTLLSPDPWSRTPDNDGRRIAPIDGGWRILNHAKFDRLRSEIEARERKLESQRKWDRENRGDRPSAKRRTPDRPRQTPTAPDSDPTKSERPPTPTPAGEEEQEPRARENNEQPEVEPTKAATVTKDLLKLGVRCAPSDPRLLRLLDAGVTPKEIVDVATELTAAGKRPSLGYVLATVEGRRTDAARAGAPRDGSPVLGKQAQAMVTIQRLREGLRNDERSDTGPHAALDVPRIRGSASS